MTTTQENTVTTTTIAESLAQIEQDYDDAVYVAWDNYDTLAVLPDVGDDEDAMIDAYGEDVSDFICDIEVSLDDDDDYGSQIEVYYKDKLALTVPYSDQDYPRFPKGWLMRLWEQVKV